MKVRIHGMRGDHDMTQKQVAEFLLCGQLLYSKYKREEREVPLNMMVKLVQPCHTSVDYLAGLTDDSRPYHQLFDGITSVFSAGGYR